MQRPDYLQTPVTPPLHHPVPQHHIPIPVMRSPALPETPNNNYNPSYTSQHQQHAYGNFFNDPTAQMAFQVGGKATEAAGAYVEQNIGKYLQVSALKHHFNVSNSYVLRKLSLVLFPWRHKPWSRTGKTGGYFLPPREDINSPDMYIPVMAFTTYILLSTILYGLAGRFNPAQLSYTASFALTITLLETTVLKAGCYLLSINSAQLLDLVAYSGYKFLGVIFTLAASSVGSRWVGYAVFAYMFNANAFFLLRSLKYVLLPDAGDRMQKGRRTGFLFMYSYGVQLVFMWALSSGFGFGK